MEGNSTFAPKPKEGDSWDVVIIGSGPAGLTAAIYTTRGAAGTLIFAGEAWGGQLMLTTVVDNYPGLPGIQGPELMQRLRDHSTLFGGEFLSKNVASVNLSKTPFELESDGKKYLAKSIIIATGADTMWLNVPGESKLRGRGVSSCAPCDAPFFKEKRVIVIGGGDSAMEEALVLTKYAKEVAIVHRRDKFRASAAMQKKVFDVEKKGRIKIIWDSEVTEFVGRRPGGASPRVGDSQESKTSPEGEILEKVKIKNAVTGKVTEMEIDGAFIAIGHIPASEIFKGPIELDAKGYIVIHDHTKTNIPGVFVAGDVHDYHYKQAVTAAGFGCMAGMDALKYLEDI